MIFFLTYLFLKIKVIALVCMLSLFSHVWLFVTPWTVACKASLSMRFPRQENWSGFPFPSPGDLPNPGMEPTSLLSLALAGGFFTTSMQGSPTLVWVCLFQGGRDGPEGKIASDLAQVWLKVELLHCDRTRSGYSLFPFITPIIFN